MATSVGFIGVGNMGNPMAGNVLKSFPLTVFDKNPNAMSNLIAAGAQKAGSAQEVLERAEIVMTCLPASPDVEALYLDAGGLVERAKPGTILIDLSSVLPSTPRAIEPRATQRGARAHPHRHRAAQLRAGLQGVPHEQGPRDVQHHRQGAARAGQLLERRAALPAGGDGGGSGRPGHQRGADDHREARRAGVAAWSCWSAASTSSRTPARAAPASSPTPRSWSRARASPPSATGARCAASTRAPAPWATASSC